MALVDMPLVELEKYKPPVERPADFDAFWDGVLQEVAALPRELRLEPVDYPAKGARVHRATFTGLGGARLSGWFITPDGPGPFPALVFYHGYSWFRGEPWGYLPWIAQGYAVLAVDVRGQAGDSDDHRSWSGGAVGGWMTRGISDPATYYYRDVYGDAVQAVEVLAARPEVDASRIAATGGSQGGGLTLVAAALSPRVMAAAPDIPFLCHFRRAVHVSDSMPYREFDEYLLRHPEREASMWRTLQYFDVLHLADRIRCPVLMSVGLRDLVCPPSTIFAVFNHLRGPKEIAVYPAHGHTVPETHQTRRLAWIARQFGDGRAE
jgi:cephalosporin-C deacetylase